MENTDKNSSRNFTEGGIFAPLVLFALPVLLALFLQAMYGAVDLLIVGQFAQTQDVSGVATGSMLIQSITMVVCGFAMGITVLVGQKIGEGKMHVVSSVIGSGVTLFFILALFLSVIFFIFAPFFSRLLHAPQEAFAETVSYIRICGGGFLFVVAYNLLGGIFRGLGDSSMPLITVAISCVFNIFADLFFVAVLQMGASGAAIATILAQAISVFISLLIIKRRTLPFRLTKKSLKMDGEITRKIIKIGFPLALQDFLVGISFLVIMAIVNSMGVVKSAGVGVAEKVSAFLMLVASAFSQSMSAFVAQNFGAQKTNRANKALFYGIFLSLLAGGITGVATFLWGDKMSAIFSNDTEVIMQSFDYLKAYAIDCFLTAFLFCFIGYFNGIGKTLFVMAQGLVGAFCVRIPVAFCMSRTEKPTLFKIALATPCSTVVQITLCLIVFFIFQHSRKLQFPRMLKRSFRNVMRNDSE